MPREIADWPLQSAGGNAVFFPTNTKMIRYIKGTAVSSLRPSKF